MNRIAHQERKRIKRAAILIKYSTIKWGIVMGIPTPVDHWILHPLPIVNVGIGITGNLKKVVRRESLSGRSTPRMTG